jgi:hypothetical protein
MPRSCCPSLHTLSMLKGTRVPLERLMPLSAGGMTSWRREVPLRRSCREPFHLAFVCDNSYAVADRRPQARRHDVDHVQGRMALLAPSLTTPDSQTSSERSAPLAIWRSSSAKKAGLGRVDYIYVAARASLPPHPLGIHIAHHGRRQQWHTARVLQGIRHQTERRQADGEAVRLYQEVGMASVSSLSGNVVPTTFAVVEGSIG